MDGDFPAGLSPEEAIAWLRRHSDRLSLRDRFRLLDRIGAYHGEESRSGDGSTLAETAALRAALPDLLHRHGVRSLLDLPCGDFHWLQEVPLEAARYLGADIVPEIVAANQEQYGQDGHRFEVLDATADPLPRVDLVLCRDLLIHLSLADIGRALRNFVASGSRLLLTNHFRDRADNPEIASGDFRPVNLCAPPFDFPPPLEVIDEHSRLAGGAFADRCMALWPLAALGLECLGV